MTGLEMRQKLKQQIDQLLPEQLTLLAQFLDSIEGKSNEKKSIPSPRQPDLHPNTFQISDDFDAPLPDSFWLGEE